MKKEILLFAVFALSFFVLKAQQKVLFNVIPVDAGSVTLTSGKSIINLSDEIKESLKDKSLLASYYVIFTPHDGSSVPSITDKSNTSFSVKINDFDKKNISATIDYIVFLKQKVIQLSTQKKAYLNRSAGN